jgi:NAD(P)-dependent dehydrogenase (short-subunit alcohol dehydrogenase family)
VQSTKAIRSAFSSSGGATDMMGAMTTRVALVTGGSSGIGEQTALLLRDAGFTTYAVARRVDRMEALARAGVTTFAMDVTDDASMVAGVERVIADQGRIDVLVNNAGYGSYGAVEDVPIDEARRQFEVNVFGLARLTQLVTPHMRAQGSGRIINVSSIGGKFYEPLGAWYHATKFAVEGLSDSLRIELAPHGIRVVIIEPGPIRTEWNTLSRDSLVEASAGTAYQDQAEKVRSRMEKADQPRTSSEPDVVARKIVKAATTARPKPRYPVGRGAGTILGARRVLPDRAFDAIVRQLYS